eukprot:980573_1
MALDTSTQPSNTIFHYNQTPAYEPAPSRDTIKQKYDELSSFTVPAKIFYNMDTLFLLYGSIKREYNSAYKNLNLHKKKISSVLKAEKQTNVITVSVKEISQAISNFRKVETKLNDWLQTISSKTMEILQNKPIVEHKHDVEEPDDEHLTSQSMPVSPIMTRQYTEPIINRSQINAYMHNKKMFNRNPLRAQYKSKTARTPQITRHKKRKKRKKKLFGGYDKEISIQPSHTKKASESFVTINKDVNKMKSVKNKADTRKR